MEHKDVLKKLKKIGLITNGAVNVKPQVISFNAFKDQCSVHRYGSNRNNMRKVGYTGHPRENLFGFFLPTQSDKDFLKQAYSILKNVVDGNMEWFDNNLVHGRAAIQWGNAGIPLAYGNMRKFEE